MSDHVEAELEVLEQQKQDAISREDYDVAKACKQQQDDIRQRALDELEEKKRTAVQVEDYDEAKRLKEQMEGLKVARGAAASGPSVPAQIGRVLPPLFPLDPGFMDPNLPDPNVSALSGHLGTMGMWELPAMGVHPAEPVAPPQATVDPLSERLRALIDDDVIAGLVSGSPAAPQDGDAPKLHRPCTSKHHCIIYQLASRRPTVEHALFQIPARVSIRGAPPL